MKYLNEYEEFDPKDFEDFEQDQKDLKNLGFDIPILGEDYGFGPDLKGKNDGKTPLYLTSDLLKTLRKKGVLDTWSDENSKTWNVVYFLTLDSWKKVEKYFEKNGGSNWKRLRDKIGGVEIHPINSKRFGDHVQLPENTPEKEFGVVWIGMEKIHKGHNPGSWVMNGEYGFPRGKSHRETDDEIPPKVIRMIYDSFIELIKG